VKARDNASAKHALSYGEIASDQFVGAKIVEIKSAHTIIGSLHGYSHGWETSKRIRTYVRTRSQRTACGDLAMGLGRNGVSHLQVAKDYVNARILPRYMRQVGERLAATLFGKRT